MLRKISIIRPDFLLISEGTTLKSLELRFCNSFWKCNSELIVVELIHGSSLALQQRGDENLRLKGLRCPVWQLVSHP